MASDEGGSLTLFKNGKPSETIKLKGQYPPVRFVDGEIVVAPRYGKLTVLNTKFEVLKTFDEIRREVKVLAGNDMYLAYGDTKGAVRYYSRHGSMTSKVSDVLKFENCLQSILHTNFTGLLS